MIYSSEVISDVLQQAQNYRKVEKEQGRPRISARLEGGKKQAAEKLKKKYFFPFLGCLTVAEAHMFTNRRYRQAAKRLLRVTVPF